MSLLQEVADAVRESGSGSPEAVASRLIFHLSERALTMTSIDRQQKAEASERIFDMIGEWLLAHPDCTCHAQPIEHERFRIRVAIVTPLATIPFYGVTLQDAYAQAAQAIMFEAL